LALAALIWSANKFVVGSVGVATKLGASKVLIGITILAIGTSLPEAVVSVVAAIRGAPSLAIGNAIGSNIANIGLILGITASILPITIKRTDILVEAIIMMLISIVIMLFLINKQLSRLESMALIVAYLICLWISIKRQKLPDETDDTQVCLARAVFYIGCGIVILPISAKFIVDSSIFFGKYFGIDETIIGLTVIALGTSLPELATCLAGIYQRETNLVIGNIIGSNIFNIAVVTGLTGVIHPFELQQAIVTRDLTAMLAIELIFCCMLYKPIAKIGRLQGIILFALYIIYISVTVAQA